MKKESGNALWFILMAIALIGALTMVLTHSSGTTEQHGDVERATIQVSDVIGYAANIQITIDKMQQRGISENEMSFQNNITAANYANANCTRGDCLVFSPAGGGAPYSNPATNVNTGDWIFSGANNVSSVGSNKPDLLMILPQVDQTICTQINAQIGINNVPQNGGAIDTGTLYAGAFPANGTIDALPGKKTGCFEDSGGGVFYFYQVLIAR